MNQQLVDPEQAKKDLETMADRLDRERYENLAGFLIEGQNKSIWEDSSERRSQVLENYFKDGGFRPLFAYNDILIDEKANRVVYDKWAELTRARIKDPVKRDILAPLEPPHPFGGKRPSLEQDYYEQMDKDHVILINMKENGISHFTPKGIVTTDGTHHEFDIIAMATGFDSLTGGFEEIDFTGVSGQTLNQKWGTDRGALSYLGITVNDFPNMFYTYGPHAPTAYSNGPSCTQKQGDWITDVCKKMRSESKTKINAKKEAEEEWKESVNKMHAMTLRHNVDSWYMGELRRHILIFVVGAVFADCHSGTNIPGKPRQVLNYAGGVPLYIKTITEVINNDLDGFEVS
jgi:cation diffusion facilitator CzcD-associated flavoprotein CzcO